MVGNSNGTPSRVPPGDVSPDALLPSKLFAGRRFVVVGGTGFLGKVWVAMLLHRFPQIAHLHLLVRPKKDQTAEERFWAQIVTSPVFDPLREVHGGGFEAFLRDKITPIPGDVVDPNLGLSDALVAHLAGKIDAVVNVAGVVDFNPPLDEALDVNAFGVNNLVSLAKALGAPVMHTSTCYVAGYRAGLIVEEDPRNVPFPRADSDVAIGDERARKLDRSHWDPQREIDECLDLIRMARHRCDDAFRQSAFLDEAKHALSERGEPCRGLPLEDELGKVKRRFIEAQLIAAGRERALFWGWTNIYTYTKSIGEQALAGSGVPYTIVRPAVIESSSFFPFPGWNEGINTSAPFLYMASKGQVQFPGAHECHLDIIPVDMVCSGMIAALAELVEGRQRPVYHLGSRDVNACRMTRYLELCGLYKRQKVRDGKSTGLFEIVKARFEPRGLRKREYEAHGARAIAGALKTVGGLLGKLAVGPAKPLFGSASSALNSAAKAELKTGEIQELFMPFVAEGDWIFSCENTRLAIARMPEDERAAFIWEPEKIDWRTWMFETHLPGLEKWVYPLIDERLQREIKPLRAYDTLWDILEEMADKYDHAVALSRLEPEGATRISFRAFRAAAETVAGRLAALGIRPGDRVILAGDNAPAWPIAYFGIVRAGAVAVPVDPGLEGSQLANIVRSSRAKLAVWGLEVEAKGGRHARELHPDLRVIDLASLADDAATSLDPALTAPKVTLRPDDLASIIYTSGTTGEPKGVMLSHGNFTSLLAALAPLFPLSHKDRVLSVLPLHHTFEFTCGLLLPLSRGARILYLDELSADRLGDGLTKGRITAMVGVPALWQLLERRILARVKEQGPAASLAFDSALELNRLLGRTLGMNAGRMFFGTVHEALGGHVRHLISGGAALPKGTADLFTGLGLPLSEGYGLTEASPVLTVSKASPRMRPGHVGKAVPGVQIKIDAPDAGGVGEVLARGPNVMQGYADNPDATAQVLADGGWLRTGDLGKLDKKGNLVLVGRQKDVIVSASGENVYPDDVETLLGKVARIKELAIVGIDDPRGGERVACLAVPDLDAVANASSSSSSSDDLGADSAPRSVRGQRNELALRALRDAFQKLPRSAQPAVVHLWEGELPRTATRKVKRNDVKALLARLVSASAPPPSLRPGEIHGGAARHAIATIANKSADGISAATSLKADLGFDSLMAMELLTALEAQVKRPLDQDVFARCETVGDVERALAEAGVGDDVLATREIEKVEQEPIKLPQTFTDPAKRLMTKVQLGFYDKVMKPRVYGRAYIPHNRNTIVASNHSSHLDMGFVKYALGTYGDGIVSLAAQDYFFEGDRYRRAYFENFTNLAAFDRKGGLRQALRQAGEILDGGKTVLIFPEGTRSSDGAVHEFKPAIGHLALTHGVDVLPVYLGGTFEALPKGRSIPIRRAIVARIGPPLEVAHLRRLTEGMKFGPASRKVAELAHMAVCALRDGNVLDVTRLDNLDALGPPREHPLVTLFRELEQKFVAGSVTQPVTYYFTLGTDADSKWTLKVRPDGCEAHIGKPEGAQADCVLKTTPEIFVKIVREAYTPSPMEFMTGLVKSNDISLLQTFQKAFALA